MGVKSFLRKTGNVAGDTLAYGGAVPTLGLSLLGKKGVTDGISGLASTLSGRPQARAIRDAAAVQVQGTKDANKLQQDNLDKITAANEPWRQAGLGALSDLSTGMKNGDFTAPVGQFQDPGQYKDPGFNFNFKEDPGYQFRQQQAQQAIERSAAARGSLFSGATLSALANESGQMASDEYGAAYGRAYGQYSDAKTAGINQANTNRNFQYGQYSDKQNAGRTALTDRFSRLSTLAGFGTNATGQNQNAYTSATNNMNDNTLSGVNATSAGIVSGVNATTAATQNALSAGSKIVGAGLGAFANGAKTAVSGGMV